MSWFLRKLWPKLGGGFLVLALLASLFSATALNVTYQLKQDRLTVVNTDTSFRLSSLPLRLSSAQIFEEIARAARDQKVNVYKIALNRGQQANSGRTILVFPGDPKLIAGNLATGAYQGFDPNYQTTLKPYSDAASVGEEAPGAYLLGGGSGANREAFYQQLRGEGLRAEDPELIAQAPGVLPAGVGNISSAELDRYASSLGLLLVLALAVVLSSAYMSANRFRLLALRRASGWSGLRALVWDYGHTVVLLLGSLVGFGLVAAAYSYLYNQGVGWQSIAESVLTVYGWIMLLALVAQGLTLLFMTWIPLGQAIKGRCPTVLLASLALIVQIFVFIGAGGAAGKSVENIQNAGAGEQQNQRLLERAQAYDNLYSFRVRGTMISDQEQFRKDIARGRRFAEIGAQKQALVLSDTSERRAGYVDGDRFILGPDVNNAYLARQPVYRADGQRFRDLPVDDNTIYLGVPESRKAEGEAQAAFYRGASSSPSPNEAEGPGQELRIEVVPLRDGQEFVDLSATGANLKKPPLVNAIIRVSNQVGSTSGVSFIGYDDLRLALQESGMAEVVVAVESVSENFLASLALQPTWLPEQIVQALLLLTALLISTVIFSTIYLDRHRRRLFVQKVFGYGFLRQHRLYLGLLLLLGIVVSLGLAGAVAAVFSLDRSPEGQLLLLDDLSWALSLSSGVVVFSLLVAVFYLLVAGRRLRIDSLKNA